GIRAKPKQEKLRLVFMGAQLIALSLSQGRLIEKNLTTRNGQNIFARLFDILSEIGVATTAQKIKLTSLTLIEFTKDVSPLTLQNVGAHGLELIPLLVHTR